MIFHVTERVSARSIHLQINVDMKILKTTDGVPVPSSSIQSLPDDPVATYAIGIDGALASHLSREWVQWWWAEVVIQCYLGVMSQRVFMAFPRNSLHTTWGPFQVGKAWKSLPILVLLPYQQESRTTSMHIHVAMLTLHRLRPSPAESWLSQTQTWTGNLLWNLVTTDPPFWFLWPLKTPAAFLDHRVFCNFLAGIWTDDTDFWTMQDFASLFFTRFLSSMGDCRVVADEKKTASGITWDTTSENITSDRMLIATF